MRMRMRTGLRVRLPPHTWTEREPQVAHYFNSQSNAVTLTPQRQCHQQTNKFICLRVCARVAGWNGTGREQEQERNGLNKGPKARLN